MLILVFLLFSSLNPQTTGAIDTLTLGQSLPWNQTLVSKGGNFELGLFSPGKSKKYYIGIWFKKVSKQTVVWVANRERPILAPSSSRFTLSDRGELLVQATPSNTLLWSSNASASSPGTTTTVATLQDDGNLVVRSNATAAAPGSVVVWQSFDHPTDTWLPGATLGYDRARGVHSFLTSWADSENPAPGAFSMVIDPHGQAKFDLLAGGTHRYWTTGLWDGEVFENVPEMRSGYFVGVPYAPNASVNLFSYHDRKPMGIGNFVLHVNGQMRRRQWIQGGDWVLFCTEPHDACDVYGSCGPFGVCSNTTSPACECPAAFAPRAQGEWALGNTAAGCARRTALECPSDGFLEMPYAVQLPNGSAEAPAGARSDRACALACKLDCSCSAYLYDGTRCSVWNGELVNLRTLPTNDDQGVPGAVAVLHLRVAASEAPPPPAAQHSWRKSMVILSSSVSAVVLLLACLIIAVAVAVVVRKRRGKGKVTAVQGSLLLFDYQAVKAATRDFTEKLGSGSFGSVYKGVLPDKKTPVAVKKLDGLRQGEKLDRKVGESGYRWRAPATVLLAPPPMRATPLRPPALPAIFLRPPCRPWFGFLLASSGPPCRAFVRQPAAPFTAQYVALGPSALITSPTHPEASATHRQLTGWLCIDGHQMRIVRPGTNPSSRTCLYNALRSARTKPSLPSLLPRIQPPLGYLIYKLGGIDNRVIERFEKESFVFSQIRSFFI